MHDDNNNNPSIGNHKIINYPNLTQHKNKKIRTETPKMKIKDLSFIENSEKNWALQKNRFSDLAYQHELNILKTINYSSPKKNKILEIIHNQYENDCFYQNFLVKITEENLDIERRKTKKRSRKLEKIDKIINEENSQILNLTAKKETIKSKINDSKIISKNKQSEIINICDITNIKENKAIITKGKDSKDAPKLKESNEIIIVNDIVTNKDFPEKSKFANANKRKSILFNINNDGGMKNSVIMKKLPPILKNDTLKQSIHLKNRSQIDQLNFSEQRRILDNPQNLSLFIGGTDNRNKNSNDSDISSIESPNPNKNSKNDKIKNKNKCGCFS